MASPSPGSVTAFFSGIETGRTSIIHACSKADFPAGCSRYSMPPQEYIARMAPQYASEPWQPVDILWQQLTILKQLVAHSDGRARLCLSAADIER